MSINRAIRPIALCAYLLITAVPIAFAQPCELLASHLMGDLPAREFDSNIFIETNTYARTDTQNECFRIRLERVPLAEFVRFVFGEALGINYAIQAPLVGEVSARSDKGLSKAQLGEAVVLLLESNGYVLDSAASGLLTINKNDGSGGFDGAGLDQATEALGSTLHVVPLRFITAEVALAGLAPFASEETLLSVNGKQRFIYIYGRQQTLDYLRSLLSLIDVNALASIGLAVVRMEHADPTVVLTTLQSILGITASEDDTETPQRIQLAVDEEKREISIIARSNHLLDTALDWIDRLDVPAVGAADRRIRVYKPLHREASAILQLAQAIVPDAANDNDLERTIQRSSLIADDDSDSILMLADGPDAARLRRLFAELDKPSTRIEVSARIIEVILNENVNFGTSWELVRALGRDYIGTSRLFAENLSEGSSGGANYLVLNSAGAERALFSALSSVGLFNVVSSPYVAMLSGGTAFVRAGEQRPVPVALVQGSARGFNDPNSPAPFEQLQVEYRDIGVSLRVTATASMKNLVKLLVEQETTDIGPLLQVTPDIQANIFLERTVGTTVTLPSGATVVLGIVQRENASTSNGGIPLFSNLPLVGPLFGNRRLSRARTELLVLLTPEILPISQPVGSAADGYVTELSDVLDALRASQVR